MRNKKVPLGNFHVSSKGKLDVTFENTDQVKVECGMKGVGASGSYTISGSRTRGLDSSTEFPTYTTAKAGGYKRYFTYGDFEEWQTVTYYGSTTNHIGLKVINGGTAFGTENACSNCNKPYGDVMSGHGTCVQILNGGTFTQKAFRNKTVSLGMDVSLLGYGIDLGVTRITGNATILRYAPKSGYNLRIYNKDTATWHCTHKAA